MLSLSGSCFRLNTPHCPTCISRGLRTLVVGFDFLLNISYRVVYSLVESIGFQGFSKYSLFEHPSLVASQFSLSSSALPCPCYASVNSQDYVPSTVHEPLALLDPLVPQPSSVWQFTSDLRVPDVAWLSFASLLEVYLIHTDMGTAPWHKLYSDKPRKTVLEKPRDWDKRNENDAWSWPKKKSRWDSSTTVKPRMEANTSLTRDDTGEY